MSCFVEMLYIDQDSCKSCSVFASPSRSSELTRFIFGCGCCCCCCCCCCWCCCCCCVSSQALRETKVLKWLVASYDDDGKEDETKKKVTRNKDVVCPFCKKKGHKTRIAKACLRHHEWLDINSSSTTKAAVIKDIGSETKSSMLAVWGVPSIMA